MKLHRGIFGPALLLVASQIVAAPVVPGQGGWSGDIEVGSGTGNQGLEEPYLTGANRGDTKRSVSGLSIQWHSLMETPLSVLVSSRDVEIDGEESGASLGLTPDARRLLRRTGGGGRPRHAFPGTTRTAISTFTTRASACACWAPPTGSTR